MQKWNNNLTKPNISLLLKDTINANDFVLFENFQDLDTAIEMIPHGDFTSISGYCYFSGIKQKSKNESNVNMDNFNKVLSKSLKMEKN